MCSGEFKLAEEDLPFLCWANDFLASLYNQGGTKRRRERDKEIEKRACVHQCVCVLLFLPLRLTQSREISGGSKTKTVVFTVSCCILLRRPDWHSLLCGHLWLQNRQCTVPKLSQVNKKKRCSTLRLSGFTIQGRLVLCGIGIINKGNLKVVSIRNR